MRLFFAVVLEPKVKAALAAVQAELKRHCAAGNFTLPDNFHITLEFLGEREPHEVPGLTYQLHQACRDETAFTLVANKLGSFPRGYRHIVWVGLDGEVQRLGKLQAGLASSSAPFTPHITLGREVVLNKPLAQISIAPLPLTFTVCEVALMESLREQGRLVYRKVATASW